MEKDKYRLQEGRKRPAYKPKNIRCPGCGAGLTVKDERSKLVVCEYCSCHLYVTESEKKVLGKSLDPVQHFPLKIGDSFHYKATHFEIIARMAFIEDGDYSELTRQYLLYNPRMGTRWLDEYQGRYSLSKDSHVMPTSNPFEKQRGDVLKTHDGRRWITEETGLYELIYVDGALPWIAKVGDRISYAEFSEKSGSGMQYDVQRIDNEIEYGMGKALPLEVVRRATKKADLGSGIVRKRYVDAAITRKLFVSVMLAALFALVVNGIMALYCLISGEVVLRQYFSADRLNQEVLSEPFPVAGDNNLIKIIARARPKLNNEWMALDVALIANEDTAVHVYDQDIQYYHGHEGGESWREGGQKKTAYIKIPLAGEYQLLLHAVSGRGSATQSTKTDHGVDIHIETGVRMPHFFIGASIASVIILFLTGVFYLNWKSGGEEDE